MQPHLHARALEAVARYYEMPFLIRRRRHDEPSAERVRLTERFADVPAGCASSGSLSARVSLPPPLPSVLTM
jgi:hypothetical protein